MARGQVGDARDKETEYIAQPIRSHGPAQHTTCTNNPVFLLEMPCAHRGWFPGQVLMYPHLAVPEAAPQEQCQPTCRM